MKKSFCSLIASLLLVIILVQAGCSSQKATVNQESETLTTLDNTEGEKSKKQENVNISKPIKDESQKQVTDNKTSNITQSSETLQNSKELIYPEPIRGIHVTAHSAGGSRLNQLITLIKTTDLNTMVIDIKDDFGHITYKIEDERYEEFSKPYIKDPKSLLDKLDENNIYPIARVVVFKDSALAESHPEYSYVTKQGEVWKNGRGEAFVNPFLPVVWEHTVELAKQAAKLGFKEIQFDYVRFPEGFERRDDILRYSMGEYKDRKPTKFITLENEYEKQIQEYEKTRNNLQENYDKVLTQYNELKQKQTEKKEITENQSEMKMKNNEKTAEEKLQSDVEAVKKVMEKAKAELDELIANKPEKPIFTDEERMVQLRVDAVSDFVAYAKKELEPFGVKVSVDIFGYTATLPEAPGIGQNFLKISQNVDVISSMIYPSHWGPGYFNIAKPDKEPYRLIKEYIKAEKVKLAQLENPPISRPWIQDFTASWLGSGNYIIYGKEQVEDQIRALNEEGIEEFLIWNASNRYTEGVDYTPLDPKGLTKQK
jgi:hypothetical protein